MLLKIAKAAEPALGILRQKLLKAAVVDREGGAKATGVRWWLRYVVLGSGNNNASSPNFGNLGLLYRTRSADDLRRWDYVGVLFKSAHTPYFRPGYLFSCPDFFRLANTTVRCSLLSICARSARQ